MGTLPPSRVLLVLLAWSLAVRAADSNLCASLNTALLGKSRSRPLYGPLSLLTRSPP